MGTIGWLILGYLALGVIMTAVSGIVITIAAVGKDLHETIKNGETDENAPDVTRRLEACGRLADFCQDRCESKYDPGNPRRAAIIAYIRGVLIWPVSVPYGLIAFWNQIKDAENN